MDEKHECHILPLFPEAEAKPQKKEKPIFEWRGTLILLALLVFLLFNMKP